VLAEKCSDICPRTLSVPRSERLPERSSRKTMSFEEQMMSKDKHTSIFPRQMEAIVFIILQKLFRNTRGFENWGTSISLGYSPVLAGAYSVT